VNACALRQGLAYLKRGKATRKNFLIFCVTGFALLICLAFLGEGLWRTRLTERKWI